MSVTLHGHAVRCLDSEQQACNSLRRGKADCFALLQCALAVLHGTNDPALAELVAVSAMTPEQVLGCCSEMHTLEVFHCCVCVRGLGNRRWQSWQCKTKLLRWLYKVTPCGKT